MLKKKLKTIAIILPFYNEEKNLKILLPEIFKSLKYIKNEVKLILVDDKSTDKSFEYCKILL